MNVGDLVLVLNHVIGAPMMGIVTAVRPPRHDNFVFVRFTDNGKGSWYHPDRVRHYAGR